MTQEEANGFPPISKEVVDIMLVEGMRATKPLGNYIESVDIGGGWYRIKFDNRQFCVTKETLDELSFLGKTKK